MALELGFLGEEMTLKIKQGSDFGPFTVTMTNPDDSPVNLTGCQFRGQIRKKADDTDPIVAFTCTITSAVNGVWTFGLTAAQTMEIPAGAVLASSESKYVWDMEMQDTASVVRPLYYGTAYVFREVTR